MDAERLLSFSLGAYRHMGVSDAVNDFMSSMWAEVLGGWSMDERIDFVRRLTEPVGHDIFKVLEFARGIFSHHDFPAEVMRPWIARVREIIGEDMAQGAMWTCIENYCRKCPSEALKVITWWQKSDPDEQSRNVIARMVARLRDSAANKGELIDDLAAFDAMLRAPGSPEQRSEYIESWAFMVDSPLLSDDLLASMRRDLYVSGGKEEIAWCFMLSRIIRHVPAKWEMAHGELALVAGPDLGLIPKYWVVEAALRGWSHSTPDSQVARDQWEDLFFQVQPLSEADLGAWKSVEMFLYDALKQHPEAARRFIVRLASTSGRAWEKLLRGSSGIHEGLTYTLKQAPNCASIITALCLSPDRSARRVGFEWFSRCKPSRLDEAMVGDADPTLIEAVLLEAMVFPLLSEDTARLHGNLVHRVDAIGGSVEDTFYDEVSHQTMDTHGYRKNIVENCGGHERILQMVEDAKKRIDATDATRTSPAMQMDALGHQRAMVLWMKRTGRRMKNGAMENSFTRLFTNISILYANKWRMVGPDGSLGEASKLNRVSAEGEMPRLESMMPEALTIKRISAEMRIRQIQELLTPSGS